jgi:hypothetical protein
MEYFLMALGFALAGLLLFLLGGRSGSLATNTLEVQALVDTIPAPAAVYTPDHHQLVTNALWRHDGDFLDGQPANVNARRELLDAVVQHKGQPNDRLGQTHHLTARRIKDGYLLVVAWKREPNAHLAPALRRLAHDLPKSWAIMYAFIDDICTNRTRSAYLHDQTLLDAVSNATAGINHAIDPLATMLVSQSEDPQTICIGALITDVQVALARTVPSSSVSIRYANGAVDAGYRVNVRPLGIRAIFEQLAFNAVRHGHATKTEIVVDVTSSVRSPLAHQRVLLYFVDDGDGFNSYALGYIRSGTPLPRSGYAIGKFGLGMGLLLCAAFAHQNDGTIEVMDEVPDNLRLRPDGGACVLLSLPAV